MPSPPTHPPALPMAWDTPPTHPQRKPRLPPTRPQHKPRPPTPPAAKATPLTHPQRRQDDTQCLHSPCACRRNNSPTRTTSPVLRPATQQRHIPQPASQPSAYNSQPWTQQHKPVPHVTTHNLVSQSNNSNLNVSEQPTLEQSLHFPHYIQHHNSVLSH